MGAAKKIKVLGRAVQRMDKLISKCELTGRQFQQCTYVINQFGTV